MTVLPESDFAGLDRAIDRVVRDRFRAVESPGILFSGGVDSSLLAWELREVPGLTLVTVGVPGSPDLAAAQSAADRLTLRWCPLTVAPEEVHDIARRVEPETRNASPTSRTVLVALACALARSPVPELLCGQGVDELFLGYAHFRGLHAAEAARRVAVDLARTRDDDGPRLRRIAGRFDRVVHAPFLHPEFVDAALAIPIGRRLPDPVPKALFRRFAEHRGLPAELAARPKRAVQYGSGIERALRMTGPRVDAPS